MKKYCEIYRISLTETICELSEPQKRRGWGQAGNVGQRI